MPELDKLIRMSHLFGVTLDELVSGEEPGAIPVSPSACVPPAPREGFSPRKVAGTTAAVVAGGTGSRAGFCLSLFGMRGTLFPVSAEGRPVVRLGGVLPHRSLSALWKRYHVEADMGDPVVYAADELRPPVHRLDTADWDGASRSADGHLFPEHDGRPIAIPKTHRVYRRLDAVLSVADTALLLLLETVVAPDGLHRLGKASAFSGSFGDDRWVAAPPKGVTATGDPLRHRRIKGRYPV